MLANLRVSFFTFRLEPSQIHSQTLFWQLKLATFTARLEDMALAEKKPRRERWDVTTTTASRDRILCVLCPARYISNSPDLIPSMSWWLGFSLIHTNRWKSLVRCFVRKRKAQLYPCVWNLAGFELFSCSCGHTSKWKSEEKSAVRGSFAKEMFPCLSFSKLAQPLFCRKPRYWASAATFLRPTEKNRNLTHLRNPLFYFPAFEKGAKKYWNRPWYSLNKTPLLYPTPWMPPPSCQPSTK